MLRAVDLARPARVRPVGGASLSEASFPPRRPDKKNGSIVIVPMIQLKLSWRLLFSARSAGNIKNGSCSWSAMDK
jgi:hypothetical protein